MVIKQEHTADVKGEHTSVVSQNPLLLRTPVPDHDRAVLGAGHHIAVLTHVALRPSNASHDVVMAEYCLHHITCRQHMLVGWSLTSLFNTNTAISQTKGQGRRVISTVATFLFSSHPKREKDR